MTRETMIPHSEGPVICHECGCRIKSREYWRRWDNGKLVFVCERCGRSMIDERTANGLMLVMDPLNDDEEDADYEFEIQAARKGEE